MAKQLKFDNVISLGVSYSWENGINSSTQSCGKITSSEDEWVKRVKNINIDVLNTDLGNQGGQVDQAMALNQARYLDTSESDIYANGSYFGKGKFGGYSIKEGSQSNDIVSSLSYTMESDGADPDPDNIDNLDDPVSIEETITVSRDIQNKKYNIEHSYSINFGNEFDLVSNHPLYSGNSSYETAEGRLLLGQNRSNNTVNVSPVNYLQYIPSLSKYASANGWDLDALSADCYGKNVTTTETKDFINGDFSLNKNIEISYTGEDIDNTNQTPWQTEYSMSWSSSEIDGESCGIAAMNGTISAGGMMGEGQCGPDAINNTIAAKSGYDYFVLGGEAKKRMTSWYGSLNSLLPKNSQSSLNPQMTNLKANQCTPSVQKGGEENNGTITFSFEMNNCKNQKQTAGGSPYSISETSSSSRGVSECNKKKVITFEATSTKSVQAKCGQQIDVLGDHPRFGSISSISKPAAPAYPTEGKNPKRWKIKSESYSYNEYQASRNWNLTYSDSPDDDACNPRCEETSGCGQFKTEIKQVPKSPRYVEATTSNGPLKVQKGNNLPTKSISTSLLANASGCNTDINSLLGNLKSELSSNTPQCVIQGLSWEYSTEFMGDTQIKGSMNGIDL
ncbi:MAG: hypothetical protein ACJARO_000120 [Bacteriovoracaceae bacterium]|jgi:hypothetical protein